MINRLKVRRIITKQEQMSDAFIINLILIFSGGFQDAYTYIVRGKVFANAQTGNLVLMSTYIIGGKFSLGLKYLFPIFAFMFGIFVADTIRHKFKMAQRLHWRQGIVFIEAATMFVVGLLPQPYNMIANCMISFSCALQLHSFKSLHGHAYASTMCIGNIRTGVSAFSSYLETRERIELLRTLDYTLIIAIFALGAGVGGNCSMIFGEKTIWASAVLMAICFLFMGLDKGLKLQNEKNEKN